MDIFKSYIMNNKEQISDILGELKKIKQKTSDKQSAEIISHIKKELNCLV